VFFIVFYGLDWVATVPPTIALCREHYGDDSAIVFGWVLASHQVGAGLVAFLSGVARDVLGTYDPVWYCAGGLCAVAALLSLLIGHGRIADGATGADGADATDGADAADGTAVGNGATAMPTVG
jgi:predicted MFS family arabinose efflux permease